MLRMLCGVACVWAEVALGQSTLTEVQTFPAERLRLATTRAGLIDVESAAVAPHLCWEASLWLGYARAPLVVYRLADKARLGALVSDRLGGTLSASLGLFDRAEVALQLPLILYQTRPAGLPDALAPGTSLSSLSGANVGDLSVFGKVRLLEPNRYGISLAVLGTLGFPTGGARSYFGEQTVVFAPELAASRAVAQLRVAVNLGALVRSRSQLLNETVESEITAHLGAGYRFAVGNRPGRPLELDGSLSAAISAAHPFANSNQTHLELRAMGGYDVTAQLQLLLGLGVGLVHGWGTPDFRVFLGGRFGKAQSLAPSPTSAPVADRDGDAIPDSLDRCPDEKETVNGFEDTDGCPDVVPDPDPDHDGVLGAHDKCPNEPEDHDGFEDDDGCPDPDNDQDGVLDVDDRCPNLAGPKQNQGCPDPDRDGDGVVDRLDNCPDEKGTVENHGCAAKQLVNLIAGKLEIIENVYFALDKADIQPRSFAVLDNVAAVLAAHPEVAHVLVEGHTDAQGSAPHNLTLSDHRAKAVVKYLVSKGIAASRLEGRGFGQARPIASNSRPEGREKNRRVVFTILTPEEGLDLRDTGPRGQPSPSATPTQVKP